VAGDAPPVETVAARAVPGAATIQASPAAITIDFVIAGSSTLGGPRVRALEEEA
jgi:hypothetical protein